MVLIYEKKIFSLPLSRSREYRFVRQIRIYAKQDGQQTIAEECASILFDESKAAINISDEKKCNNVLFVEALSSRNLMASVSALQCVQSGQSQAKQLSIRLR